MGRSWTRLVEWKKVTVDPVASIGHPDRRADLTLRPVLLTLGRDESDDVPTSQMRAAVPDEPDHYLVG